MRRRDFIKGIVGSATVGPLAARAQQPDRTRPICVLMGFEESDPVAQSWIAAFRDRFAKLGWTEGSNLRIELREPVILTLPNSHGLYYMVETVDMYTNRVPCWRS
jgi:hypothetical protein